MKKLFIFLISIALAVGIAKSVYAWPTTNDAYLETAINGIPIYVDGTDSGSTASGEYIFEVEVSQMDAQTAADLNSIGAGGGGWTEGTWTVSVSLYVNNLSHSDPNLDNYFMAEYSVDLQDLDNNIRNFTDSGAENFAAMFDSESISGTMENVFGGSYIINSYFQLPEAETDFIANNLGNLNTQVQINGVTAAVPEPGTILILSIILSGFGALKKFF